MADGGARNDRIKMIEIIPAIIAKDFQELEEKISKVKPFVDWVQLDVMDGKFVESATWNNPEELPKLTENCSPLKLEAHLMIEKPEDVIDKWIKSGVKRIIFHYEATGKHQEIIDKIYSVGLRAGIAINPETPIDVFEPFLKVLSFKFQVSILIMSVHPGKGGQKFLEEALPKIKDLREKYHDVIIGVDGGINLETASKVIQAGADILAVGSGIFEGDIEENIKLLKEYTR